ncbi:MAG: hypothetical protein V1720_02475 [bacterium]
MKKLFQNYNYNFDKNEKKMLINFCKQAIKQMSTDEKFFQDINSFQSIITKLSSNSEEVKLSKQEKTRLVLQLEENSKFLKQKMSKSWFLKKWLYGTMYKQYNNILSQHFSD